MINNRLNQGDMLRSGPDVLTEFAALMAEKLPKGTPIFVYAMPSTDMEGVLIRILVPASVNPEIPNLRDAEFQVIARSKEYLKGKTLATEAVNAIATMGEMLLPSHLINLCVPLHEPHPFPQSGGGVVEVVVNMRANYVILL